MRVFSEKSPYSKSRYETDLCETRNPPEILSLNEISPTPDESRLHFGSVT